MLDQYRVKHSSETPNFTGKAKAKAKDLYLPSVNKNSDSRSQGYEIYSMDEIADLKHGGIIRSNHRNDSSAMSRALGFVGNQVHHKQRPLHIDYNKENHEQGIQSERQTPFHHY